jgi:hypothetical protein
VLKAESVPTFSFIYIGHCFSKIIFVYFGADGLKIAHHFTLTRASGNGLPLPKTAKSAAGDQWPQVGVNAARKSPPKKGSFASTDNRNISNAA